MSVTEKAVHQSDLVRVLSCSFSVEVRQILENRENSTVDQTCVVAPYGNLDACQKKSCPFPITSCSWVSPSRRPWLMPALPHPLPFPIRAALRPCGSRMHEPVRRPGTAGKLAAYPLLVA